MRALRILQEGLARPLEFMHAKRCTALWRAVTGLLNGQHLWLTALGRSLPGACADKHRIKAIDRLVGSAAVQQGVSAVYAALAAFLLRGVRRPVILVDWTGADPGFAVLSAKLCFRGRALTLLSRTFPKARKCSPPAEREFLDELRTIIPSYCEAVIVTDAGFLFEWFVAVSWCGWSFVGRIRGKTTVRVEEEWMALAQVHTLATRHHRDLGRVALSKKNELRLRCVLSARPKLKGRTKVGRSGARTHSTADRQRRAAAREPWVLVTSLSDPAHVVVGAYAKRMQIEETFRDIKSHRYGWSAEDIRGKDPRRIDVLLLIGALATVVMHILGLAATHREYQRGFQANTERRRAVFSTFFLARLIIARRFESLLPNSTLRVALVRLRTLLVAASLEPNPTPS